MGGWLRVAMAKGVREGERGDQHDKSGKIDKINENVTLLEKNDKRGMKDPCCYVFNRFVHSKNSVRSKDAIRTQATKRIKNG